MNALTATTDTVPTLQEATIAEAAAKARVDDLTARVDAVRANGHQPSGGLKKSLREAKATLTEAEELVRVLAATDRADRARLEAVDAEIAANDPTATPATEAPVASAPARRRPRPAKEVAATARPLIDPSTAIEPEAAAPAPAPAPSTPKQRGKLSMDDAIAIVRAVDAGTKRRALAEQYCVHVTTIADILVGRYLKGAVDAARSAA